MSRDQSTDFTWAIGNQLMNLLETLEKYNLRGRNPFDIQKRKIMTILSDRNFLITVCSDTTKQPVLAKFLNFMIDPKNYNAKTKTFVKTIDGPKQALELFQEIYSFYEHSTEQTMRITK